MPDATTLPDSLNNASPDSLNTDAELARLIAWLQKNRLRIYIPLKGRCCLHELPPSSRSAALMDGFRSAVADPGRFPT